jgi:endonuclease/exonuclease/phosphatase family metal-dependent hydrolase
VTAALWGLTTGLAPLSLAWLFSEWSWTIDLIANIGAQVLLVTMAVLLAAAALRRRGVAMALLVCCLLHLIPLATGRALIFPRQPTPAGGQRDPQVVRFLHYNDSTRSPKEQIDRLMDESDADVIHLLSPIVAVQTAYMYDDGLRPRYPGVIKRFWEPFESGGNTKITAALVCSRWPIERVDFAQADPMGDRLLAGIVERPGGAFAVIAVHPRSPRNEGRWHEGNGVTNAVRLAANTFAEQGLPVVVLTDLNATPTGYRSRLLWRQANLRRGKPLLYADGTHPGEVFTSLQPGAPKLFKAFWPLRLAIDDVMVSPGLEVTGWAVLPDLGAEHSPVLAEVRIGFSSPGPATPNPAGR